VDYGSDVARIAAHGIRRTICDDTAEIQHHDLIRKERGRRWLIVATLDQQRLNVDQVRDQTRANVVQAWAQLQAAKVQIEAAQRQNNAAERALTGVRDEALAGQRTTQDVLNAEQALVNARQSLIVAQHDRVVASYSLLSAVGRLSAQVLALPVPVYDPMVHYQQVRDTWIGLRTPSGQ
jgi:outer membrane protein